jgi:hypothetical protein
MPEEQKQIQQDGGRGGDFGPGLLVGVIIVVVVILLLLFLLPGFRDPTPAPVNDGVNNGAPLVPNDINVEINGEAGP